MAIFVYLSAHHRVGDHFENSVIAAAATGGAMSGLLYVLKNVKEIFNLCVLVERIEDVEVGYVLAVADLEICCGSCINGLEVAGLLFVCHWFVLRVIFY